MSIDLLMYKGDLGITKDKSGRYDLVIEEAGQNLLRRSVVTPPSWIKTWVIEDNKVVLIDDEYGNRIYLQLSDPMNLHWLSIAKSHVKNSLDFIRDEELITIKSFSIAMSSSNGISPDTADIHINYSYEGKNKSYQEKIKI